MPPRRRPGVVAAYDFSASSCVVATTSRAALAEVIDDGRAERAAFDRIGAAADLVEQHERRQLERAIHLDDVGDVRRERAEARRDRLLVADVREDRPERRERAAGLDRNQQPGLRHDARAVRTP